MRKKDLALEVIDRLKKCYPESDCTLDYNEAWKLLISVRLAAQCTDERVNKIVPKLYEKFPDIESLANADVAEITEIVKPCGLGNSKARDISLCMKMLRDKYDCKVPDDFDELLKLPGVGRKSANLIMGDVFGKRPLAVRRGGSIPIIAVFEQVLGIKSILMGFGLESYATHSPNENIPVDILQKGIIAVVGFYKNFGH